MNCNANTTGNVNIGNSGVSTDSCSQECISKPINLVCNQLIIPPTEIVLSNQFDKNVNTKIFYLPTSDMNGVSWIDKQFYILTEQGGQKNKKQIKGDDLEITDNYIKLTWLIDETVTAIAGDVNMQVEIVGEEYQYYSNMATFKVLRSIDVDNEIISGYPLCTTTAPTCVKKYNSRH